MNRIGFRLWLLIAFLPLVRFATAQNNPQGWALGPFIRPANANPIISPDSLSCFRMKRSPKPVLYPDEDAQKENEWPGGCEDPRIAVTEEGLYVMLYTQWNRKVFRLAVATSKDLVNMMIAK